jgi:hypothetical protein
VFVLKRLSTKFLHQQEGSSIVLVGLSLIALLVTIALVVDGGSIFIERSHLQKTANAAVLSGAQELTNQQSAVTNVINTILQHHEESGSLMSSTIHMGQDVSVHLSKKVPLGFSKLFGKDTEMVGANAAAQIMPISSASGIAPVGIKDTISLIFGQQYMLKVDQTQSVSGNFGILRLGGPGAKIYEDNLMYGYNNQVQVGDIIDTQPGNIAGKTREAIQYRIDSSHYMQGDTSHTDDSRIIIIPVYKPYDVFSNHMKQVQVTGFAYFYITDPTSSKDTSIIGMFIKKAGFGAAKSGALDKGAYTIRLTE